MGKSATATMLLVLILSALSALAPDDGGQSKRLPVVRDTWFSNVGKEADGNLGGATRLKLKSHQEMTLVDIDPESLRGWVVRNATLHVRLAGDVPLRRVTVSSFGADWVEGTASNYAPQNGSSTFHHRRHPDVPWTIPGSDLCSVMLGAGGTLWRMADATALDERQWQEIPVDPAVVAARVAGISYGFLVFDDTGTEWKRNGDKFTLFQFPNRFIFSREAGAASAPYFTVQLGPRDVHPPETPSGLRADSADLPAGEAWVSWETPPDRGPAGTVGFFVRVNGRELPRYLVPLAGRPGERVRMLLRDFGLRTGEAIELAVRAVDAAGNIGPEAAATFQVAQPTAPTLPPMPAAPGGNAAPLPRLGSAEVAVIDELDKVQPISGQMIPAEPDVYLSTNHLWSAQARQIRLHAARNEFVAFQILLRGRVDQVKPILTFSDSADAPEVSFGRYWFVPSRKGPLPDPIVPLYQPLSVPDRDQSVPGQTTASLYCEIYVPHNAAAGRHNGKLLLQAGDQSLTLNVALEVWDFTLPDYLSFLPEMNCYGLPANELAYYRLAHQHRTVLNRVPYYHRGNVAPGCAPVWNGKQFSWQAWDNRFGRYFDGSAFSGLPRKGVPLECFYLPLFENWPIPMEGNYNGSYWADRAFPESYRHGFADAAQQLAEHFNAKGWDDTLFQCYFNGKYNFKSRGWSFGTCPWLLDEPASFQDFWALRYYGETFHEGTARAAGKAKMVFRCDISRPQWQRDTLDGLLDYNVVGSAMRRYHRQVFDRKSATGELVIEYGTTNAIEAANVQPVGWCLDAWLLGTDGVLPWQTVGTRASWQQADTLSLFYPGPARNAGPLPSVRLKAFRRGQQDVEYLTLWMQQQRLPRWAVGQVVRQSLALAAERKGTGLGGGEDAGVLGYTKLRPRDDWMLRMRVGQALSAVGPAPRRKLVDLRTPPRDLARLAPGYISQ